MLSKYMVLTPFGALFSLWHSSQPSSLSRDKPMTDGWYVAHAVQDCINTHIRFSIDIDRYKCL